MIEGDFAMAHDVFISHATNDRATVELVRESLENYGLRCWLAYRDIPPGANWTEAIVDAIECSTVMVLVFSVDSNQSRQVSREVEQAVNAGVTIIPFRLQDVPYTKSMAYLLSPYQWLDALSPPLEARVHELANRISQLLSPRDPHLQVDSMPKPMKTILGGSVGEGVNHYLLDEALTYMRESKGLDYYFASKSGRNSMDEPGQSELDDYETNVRVVNDGDSDAVVVFTWIDFESGKSIDSEPVRVQPSQSYVAVEAPAGFGRGGTTVASDQPITGRAIVRLRIDDRSLSVRDNVSLRFRIPIAQAQPLHPTHATVLIVLGANHRIRHVSELPCEIDDDRLIFGADSLATLVEQTRSVDGLLLVRIEGEFVISESRHELAAQYMEGYSKERASLEFETTTEVVPISL